MVECALYLETLILNVIKQGGMKMGYILPVNNYQYSDYHNYMVNPVRMNYTVERPFRVMLEKRHHEVNQAFNRLRRNSPVLSKNYKVNNEKWDEINGEMTGKGQIFSEQV